MCLGVPASRPAFSCPLGCLLIVAHGGQRGAEIGPRDPFLGQDLLGQGNRLIGRPGQGRRALLWHERSESGDCGQDQFLVGHGLLLIDEIAHMVCDAIFGRRRITRSGDGTALHHRCRRPRLDQTIRVVQLAKHLSP